MADSSGIDLEDVNDKLDVLTLDLLSLLDVQPEDPDSWSVAQKRLKERLRDTCQQFLEDEKERLSSSGG